MSDSSLLTRQLPAQSMTDAEPMLTVLTSAHDHNLRSDGISVIVGANGRLGRRRRPRLHAEHQMCAGAGLGAANDLRIISSGLNRALTATNVRRARKGRNRVLRWIDGRPVGHGQPRVATRTESRASESDDITLQAKFNIAQRQLRSPAWTAQLQTHCLPSCPPIESC